MLSFGCFVKKGSVYFYMEYSELSVRSYYSFLRGGSSPEELFKRGVELGLSALALTDLHGVYGIPKAYQVSRSSESKTKLITGAELVLRDAGSVTLLAQDRKGYGNLCRIFTEAHRNHPKGYAELSVSDFFSLDQGGLLFFPEWENDFEAGLKLQDIVARFEWVKNLETGKVWTPLSRALDGRDELRTRFGETLRNFFQGPVLARNRVLYHDERRRELQDVLTAVRLGASLLECGLELEKNTERRLKSPEEMRRLFSDLPDALQETSVVRELCIFSPGELRYRYPTEWIPQGMSSAEYLKSLCELGKKERYPGGVPAEISFQVERELQIVSELGFSDYFLTVYDIVQFAREREILCQGRGSAANSVICYLIGITAIDPVQMGLLFERFISAERGEPPDIDVDFEHDRREEVLQYVYEKYGRNRAAMVSAVVTYQWRSALRETAKAFGVPVGSQSAREVEKYFLALDPDSTKKEFRKIYRIAEAMEGFPRHLSIHSGGFTLSADPMDELVPIEPASMEGRTIIQWDKYDLDILGLLKVDLLALGMLSAVRRCLGLVGKSLYEIPHDDRATYQMIQRADTIGTFQVESRAQMSMLPRLLPENFYDLVVQIALVRPGPIVGKMVHPYLKRRRGEEKWTLPHPALGPILGRTYGVPVFQEQVMRMAIALAGFTPGEADQLRRAIGAWRSKGSLDMMGQRLMNGLIEAGVSREFSEQVFLQIQGFSEYGFPESHAASFALIAYASCYLKCHFPAEFLVAMLNSQPLGFYSSHTLVDDAKRHGVQVHSVCVVHSEWESKLERASEKSVRLGFHRVRGMSTQEWESIRDARLKPGFQGFRSFQDFLNRTHLKHSTLTVLARADSFRALGVGAREALWKILALQVELFRGSEVQGELYADVSFPDVLEEDQVVGDYDALGLSARAHPMKWVRASMGRKIPDMDTRKARLLPNGARVSIPGISVVIQRPPTAKGTAFATLEDEYGFLDLIFWKDVYQRCREAIHESPLLIVRGVIQRDGGSVSLVVRGVIDHLN